MGHGACATGNTIKAAGDETSGRRHTERVNAVSMKRYHIPEGKRLSSWVTDIRQRLLREQRKNLEDPRTYVMPDLLGERLLIGRLRSSVTVLNQRAACAVISSAKVVRV